MHNIHITHLNPSLAYAALILFPICAWKPVLIADTDRPRKNMSTQFMVAKKHIRDPHDSQVIKYSRFSLSRIVSGDLQILHVTYSTAFHVSIHAWDTSFSPRQTTHRYTFSTRSQSVFVYIFPSSPISAHRPHFRSYPTQSTRTE